MRRWVASSTPSPPPPARTRSATARCGSRRSTMSRAFARERRAPTRSERDALMAEAGLHGPGFCRAYADLVDTWLTGLLGDAPGAALVAVGGYGRRELCP